MLSFLDRCLVNTIVGAVAVDRWVLGHLTDALTDVVLPAVDATVQRARSMWGPRT